MVTNWVCRSKIIEMYAEQGMNFTVGILYFNKSASKKKKNGVFS